MASQTAQHFNNVKLIYHLVKKIIVIAIFGIRNRTRSHMAHVQTVLGIEKHKLYPNIYPYENFFQRETKYIYLWSQC